MRDFLMPVVLQLAGVLIIIAEIFLPSGGLLSLVAAGLFGYSLFIVFHDISTMAGTYFILADLIIIPA
ncbi:MAG: serine protease, partial [Thermodesulfobacteriota bacterium]